MKQRKEEIYIAPAMEVISIEVEQAILNGSNTIENIGNTLPEKDW
jgi:hypothetical protein